MMATRPPVPALPRLALSLAVLPLIAGPPAPAPGSDADAPATTRTGPTHAGEAHPTFLIRDARIVDGTGAPAFRGSVRIHGDRISSLGDLAPRAGERVIEAGGMLLVPGFIDAGETVGRLPESREAPAAVSRGVTTIVVGTRGHHRYPLAAWFDSLRLAPYAVNVASFAGLRTLREAATSAVSPGRAGGGPGDPESAAPEAEIERLRKLLRRELEAGALGLSVGAEPVPRAAPRRGSSKPCARTWKRPGARSFPPRPPPCRAPSAGTSFRDPSRGRCGRGTARRSKPRCTD